MRRSRTRLFHTTLTLFMVFVLLLLLKNADIAANGIQKGIILCRDVLLPSTLPFLVISELFLSCGVGGNARGAMGGVASRLFGISRAGEAALLGGLICGVPVGVVSATALYKKGELSFEDLSRLLPLCAIPSAPFLITVVGKHLLGDQLLGIWLYLSLLISTFTVGILRARLFTAKALIVGAHGEAKPILFDLTGSIRRGGYTFLQICAFVLFFSFVAECVNAAFAACSLPILCSVIVSGMLEITTGMQGLACISPALSPILAAFFAGFSGLSIALQIFSISEGTGRHALPYLLCKLLIGTLSAALLCLFIHIGVAPPATASTAIVVGAPLHESAFISLFLLGTLFVLSAKRRKRKK